MLSHVVINRLWLSIFVVICLILVLLLFSGFSEKNLQEVKAQDNLSFNRILVTLNEQVKNQELELFFRFVTPITGNEIDWTIPSYDQEGNYINRAIEEIGDDYICFIERFGEVTMINCTPYSNIASIKYVS